MVVKSGKGHLDAVRVGLRAVGLMVAQYGYQHVDAALGQADQGSVLSASPGALAVTAGAGVVVGRLVAPPVAVDARTGPARTPVSQPGDGGR